MRYQGSKKRMSKVLKRIIENNIDKEEWYVEPFCGGCNSLSCISHNKKVGCDINEYVIYLWNKVKYGEFTAPSYMNQMIYDDIKNDYEEGTEIYPKDLIAYTAICCSYGSSWFNGFSRYNEKKKENHVLESKRGFEKHVSEFINLNNTIFLHADYKDLILTERSFIYCDPPYQNTKGYIDKNFDSEYFFEWCRNMVYNGHKVLISEYSAPSDFICIWSKEMQDGMSSDNGKKIEKLFIHISQIPIFKI